MPGMDKYAMPPAVVIVGAGVAGLSAADHLWNNGFRNITILEAMDRIGGRIHTTKFGQSNSEVVELGANWIHGGCAANPMFNLANRFQLLPGELIILDRMEGHFYVDGHVIDKDLVERVFQMFGQWERGDCEYKIKPKPGITLQQYLKDRLSDHLGSFAEREQPDVKCIFNCLMNLTQFRHAGFLERRPWMENDEHVNLPGGNIKVPGGIIKLVDGLLKNLPSNVVNLRKEVTQIRSDEAGVQVSCKDGTKYNAHHVICTMSVAYLKTKASSLFEPALHPAKIASIQGIPLGKVNKIFLQWDEPFWRKGRGSIKLAWTDEEATVKSESEWYKKIFGFDEVLNNPNVLVAWISGNEAEYIEHLSDEDLIEKCTWLIRRFCSDPSIPGPAKILRSKWCSNPYILGAYSTRDFSTRPEHLREIGEPVFFNNQPRVLFAGEATSRVFHSSMHGARLTGLREADRLIHMYGSSRKSQL